jgi:DNA-3-methyladenine glycosylase
VRGLEDMRLARPAARAERDLCNGPAKLCQALGITGSDNGTDLLAPGGDRAGLARPVRLAADGTPPPTRPGRGTRIGIKEATQNRWRFWVRDSPFVSRG